MLTPRPLWRWYCWTRYVMFHPIENKTTARPSGTPSDDVSAVTVPGVGFKDDWLPETSMRPHSALCGSSTVTVLWDQVHLHSTTLNGQLNTRRGGRVLSSSLVNLTCLAYTPTSVVELERVLAAKLHVSPPPHTAQTAAPRGAGEDAASQ